MSLTFSVAFDEVASYVILANQGGLNSAKHSPLARLKQCFLSIFFFSFLWQDTNIQIKPNRLSLIAVLTF